MDKDKTYFSTKLITTGIVYSAALFRRHLPRRIGDRPAAEADAAGIRRLEAGDQSKKRGLAATGRAEQCGERVGRKVERNAVQPLYRIEAA